MGKLGAVQCALCDMQCPILRTEQNDEMLLSHRCDSNEFVHAINAHEHELKEQTHHDKHYSSRCRIMGSCSFWPSGWRAYALILRPHSVNFNCSWF